MSAVTELIVHDVRFLCETKAELWRAERLLTKEPGTIAWLDQLQPGQVFYDIGANIGCYTLYAAQRVGPEGHVYAFEPHLPNAISLLRNVSANGFTDQISVITTPLWEKPALKPFYYAKLSAGTSGHQIEIAVDEFGRPFTPVLTEWKCAVPLNGLLWCDRLRPPDFIKIDVDGAEPQILAGMSACLAGICCPKPLSLQVELCPRNAAGIVQHLLAAGYKRTQRHDTISGQRALAQGYKPDELTYNQIFQRAA